jgi:hypothetical protein
MQQISRHRIVSSFSLRFFASSLLRLVPQARDPLRAVDRTVSIT